MKINGKIDKILGITEGVSKQGKEWKKMGFTIETDDKYNKIKYFEIWGFKDVENFNSSYSLNDYVWVYFNIKCNEYNNRYFTNLEAWKIEPYKPETNDLPTPEDYENQVAENENDDLPF